MVGDKNSQVLWKRNLFFEAKLLVGEYFQICNICTHCIASAGGSTSLPNVCWGGGGDEIHVGSLPGG